MWVSLSLVSLLVAALCWIVGDALIVGFHKPEREKYRDFIELMGDDAYAYQLTGSEPRLRWGALIANYSVPLLLAGLYAHGVIMRESTLGLIGVVLMGIGMALSPLAHAAFYPLALISQRIYARQQAGEVPQADVRVAHQLFTWLKLAWLPAVGLTFIGGIVFGVALALGHSALPWWSIAFLPIVWLLPINWLLKLPYPGKPLLDGAGLNLALAVWVIALFVLTGIYGVR